MKYAIIAALLLAFGRCLAEQNTDSEGYVTNSSLLVPFTFTNKGVVISNAVLVKLTPNKFIYKTPDGGEGMLPIAILPEKIQSKCGYNATAALLATESDAQKQVALAKYRSQQIRDGEISALRRAQIQFVVNTRTVIWARVIQRTGTNLLIDSDSIVRTYNEINDLHSTWIDGDHWTCDALPTVENDNWGGAPNFATGTVLLSDYKYISRTFDGDKFAVIAFPIGTYKYTTVMGAEKIVPRYTADFNSALDFYLNGRN